MTREQLYFLQSWKRYTLFGIHEYCKKKEREREKERKKEILVS